MTFKLLIQLIFGVFSFDPKNMRWFNLKRIIFCIIGLPVFISILLINRLFLVLDYIIFPRFISQKIIEPVFIIAAPRSATTFLFHSIAKNSDKYSSVKLWEIIFAPSVIQKYLIIGFFRFDKLIGSPIKNSVLFLENLIFGKFKKIHMIGLLLPEEDEGFLIWDLTTLFLTFFYPDCDFFEKYYQFDKSMDEKSRKRIMKSYFNYIKRHNYVYNRNNERQFLSKNPLMMNKIASLYNICPDAKILNINRNPSETIPSTQELNRTIYSIFSSQKANSTIDNKTMEILIGWYQLAHENLTSYYKDRHLKIDFKKLIQQDNQELKTISDFLSIDIEGLISPIKKEVKSHKSSNKYEKLSKQELDKVLEKLPFMAEYCS